MATAAARTAFMMSPPPGTQVRPCARTLSRCASCAAAVPRRHSPLGRPGTSWDIRLCSCARSANRRMLGRPLVHRASILPLRSRARFS